MWTEELLVMQSASGQTWSPVYAVCFHSDCQSCLCVLLSSCLCCRRCAAAPWIWIFETFCGKRANGQNVSIFCDVFMAVLDHPPQPRLVCMLRWTLSLLFFKTRRDPCWTNGCVCWQQRTSVTIWMGLMIVFHCIVHTMTKWFISLFFQIKSHHSQLVAHCILVFSFNVSVWFCNAFFPVFAVTHDQPLGHLTLVSPMFHPRPSSHQDVFGSWSFCQSFSLTAEIQVVLHRIPTRWR